MKDLSNSFSTLDIREIRIDANIPQTEYYASLPAVRQIILEHGISLTKPITFFLGENGIGKSTLIEAVAVAAGFTPEGGTRNYSISTVDSHSSLHAHIHLVRGMDKNAIKKAEITRLDNERTVTGKLLQELIDQNARVAQDQTDYQQRSDEMFARYEAAEKALAEAQESLHQKEKHNEQTLDFISEIESMPDSITEFRTEYWGHLVEKVTVHRKGKLVFTFSCGVEIEV